jgi:hypothetical protein
VPPLPGFAPAAADRDRDRLPPSPVLPERDKDHYQVHAGVLHTAGTRATVKTVINCNVTLI